MRSSSSDRSEATPHGSDGQPAVPAGAGAGSSLKPARLGNEAASASRETAGDRTDSNSENKPVEQDSEQDTLIRQQIGSREAAPAVGTAAERGQSPGVAQRLGGYDGEEKRDQSKEEPPLELRPQEGWLRMQRPCEPWIYLVCSLFVPPHWRKRSNI